ncbi:MAG: DUF3857 domain-containing protein [Bacteroidia bacterium]
MKSTLSLVLCLMAVHCLRAQPLYNFDDLKKNHAGEHAVIIKNNCSYDIGIKKGQLSIQSTKVLGFTVLEDKARISSEYDVSYSPGFYELESIEAATYVRGQDNKYTKNKVSKFEDYSDYTGYVFYDDTRHRKFYFPGLKEGTYAEVSYTYQYLRPQFLGGHFFQPGSWATLESSLVVNVDEGVEIDFSLFGDTSGVIYSQTTLKGKTTHTWSRDQSRARKYFDDAPSSLYYAPHVYIRVRSYTYKGKTERVLGDVKDLYRFNYSFLNEVNAAPPSSGIVHVVDSLKQVNPNVDSLIQNIFYWVQNNIKYIAIEDGLGGYIPRQANLIYDNRYGDCKDKSSIITCMLKTAEIPSYMVWIGSRDIPYTYSSLPTPNVDNHMIAAVKRHGQWIFLDGTASHLQYGYPTNFIQGKEALISIDPDSFAVVQVPVIPSQENQFSDSMTMRIEGGVLHGTGKVTLEKMQKFMITEMLLGMKEDARTKRLEDLNRKGNNKCKIDHMEVSNLHERNKNLEIEYAISIPDYVKDIEDNLYLNMWLSKSYLSEKIDTSARYGVPREVPFTYTDNHHYKLEIPAGYRLKQGSLPAPVEYSQGDVVLSYSYKQVGNHIFFDYTFSVDTLLLNEAQFLDWNNAVDLLLKAYGEVIILEKQP